MIGLLDPTYKETFLGNAQIRRRSSPSPRSATSPACMVTEGMVKRGRQGFRLLLAHKRG